MVSASASASASATGPKVSKIRPRNSCGKLGVLYQFTRPYQIYGTILAILSISLVPVQAISDLSPTFFLRLLKTIIPVVLLFVYTNGLNQITDIEIDKINKPFLPLPSGDLSLTEAKKIISFSIVASFVVSATLNSSPLLIAIMIIFFLFSTYSILLHILKWKNYAVTTTATIISTYVLGRSLMDTKPVLFTVALMISFSVVISVFKDIPDVKGDKEFGIRSASVVYGVEKVFWSCVYLLLATYGGAAAFGATSALFPAKIIAVLGHGIPAIMLWTRAKSTNISDPVATLSFYLFIWKLLYIEYLFIPFVR